MARVRFLNVGLEVEVAPGASILDAARAIGAPEASHCSGVCACSTCHVYIEGGSENLAPAEQDELDMLELAARDRRPTSRLGCQTRLVGDGVCDVTISDESFRTYLDEHPDDRERALRLWRKHKRDDG